MNQAQRKFLIDRVESRTKSIIDEIKILKKKMKDMIVLMRLNKIYNNIYFK